MHADTIPRIRGLWRLDVYEGDVVREPLTVDQYTENEAWLEDALHYGGMPEGRHQGRVLNDLVATIEGENLVTNNGKALILDRLFALGGPPSHVTHLGVGNSATSAAVTDTQLLGSTPSPYLQAFDALPTRSVRTVTTVTTVATGNGNQNWQELGLFNGGTNGTSVLLNRIAPIGPFNKTSAVSIVVTVTIEQL